jgi:branched-chain amino acid transport system ATP-binding protein
MTMSAVRLDAMNLSKRFGGVVALDDVSVSVPGGAVVAVLGRNGAGKSTLLQCVSGSMQPDTGRVVLDGRDVTALPPDARARRGLVQTFQTGAVYPTLTVRENLQVGAEHRHRRNLLRGFVHLAGPDTAGIVRHVLDDLGLSAIADTLAGSLPTGTRRLVEIGRALCAQPSVLLLDEPTSGLDRRESDAVGHLIREVAGRDVSVLAIEHDLRFVLDVADSVLLMAAGRVVARGSPRQLADADLIARAGEPR